MQMNDVLILLVSILIASAVARLFMRRKPDETQDAPERGRSDSNMRSHYMNGKEIDVKAIPPTTEELVRERQHYSEVFKALERRERRYKLCCYAIGGIGFGVVLVRWLMGDITGGETLACAIAALVAGALPLVFAGTIAAAAAAGTHTDAQPLAFAGVVAAAVAVVVAIAGAIVPLVVFSLPFLVGFAGAITYTKWIDSPRSQASDALGELVELEHGV